MSVDQDTQSLQTAALRHAVSRGHCGSSAIVARNPSSFLLKVRVSKSVMFLMDFSSEFKDFRH